jgi:hypothetical protein
MWKLFKLSIVSLCLLLAACGTATPHEPVADQAAPSTAVRLNPPRALPEVQPSRPAIPSAKPLPDELRASDAIVIAGQRFSIGAPVVLWTDPGGFSAYSTEPHFDSAPRKDPPTGLRYRPGRARGDVDIEQPTPAQLTELIDQFVLHFDVCGVSSQCFKVLQDIRGLSVHFLLDIDGTLYQTLDLRDTAWHARQANPRSIGVEIANIGAYPAGEPSLLDSWYERDDAGWRIKLPERLGDGGVRTRAFVGRPARTERIVGDIQGETLEQFDFTPEQYETLAKLTAVLCQVLPRLEPDAPRDARGRVRTDALDEQEFEDFRGILGHNHVTTEKTDPGPAMDWERLLQAVRARLR